MSDRIKRELADYFGNQYDSDEDLDEETRKKIQNQGPIAAEKTRNEAWDKADMYPKLKRFLKGVWYGDKRKKE